MSVNIPRDVEDMFYRYKMPLMETIHQGRGNGVKTIFVNLPDIANALERSDVCIIKFFEYHFGAGVSMTKGKYIINGKFDHRDLEAALDVFIDRYVLCGMCGNPETTIRSTRLRCKACGAKTPLSQDKLTAFIKKNK